MRFLSAVVFGTLLTLQPSAPARAQSAGGLRAEITSVAISGNRKPVVTFKISDGKGAPLGLEDLDRDSIRFTIAVLIVARTGERSYRNYVLNRTAGQEYVYGSERRNPVMAESLQPSADQGGMLSTRGAAYLFILSTLRFPFGLIAVPRTSWAAR